MTLLISHLILSCNDVPMLFLYTLPNGFHKVQIYGAIGLTRFILNSPLEVALYPVHFMVTVLPCTAGKKEVLPDLWTTILGDFQMTCASVFISLWENFKI